MSFMGAYTETGSELESNNKTARSNIASDVTSEWFSALRSLKSSRHDYNYNYNTTHDPLTHRQEHSQWTRCIRSYGDTN